MNTFAGLKDVYKYRWLDPKKEVFVLQDKMHENEGRFFISAGFLDHKLSEFQSVTGINGTAGYYFSEEWAVEGFYNHYMNSNNGAYKAVLTQTNTGGGGTTNIVLPHVVRWDNMMGLNVLYTPFYGKINTFNLIFYIDLGFGLGASWNKYSHNTAATQANLKKDAYESDSTISYNWKFQFKWHITKTIKFKFDFVNYLATIPSLDFNGFQAGGTGSHTESTEFVRSYDLLASIGFMF